jgi:hypothetical protein
MREDKLAELRGQEAEALMQQPGRKREVNERKGISEQEAAAPEKLAACQEDKRPRLCNKRQHDNQPANERQTGVEVLPLPRTTKTPHNNQMGLRCQQT